MAWITPVTDWASMDYYNFGDLDRVENNIAEIETLINSYSSMSGLTIITSRDMTAIEFFDSINRIEGNILALKDASGEPIGWLTPRVDWVSVLVSFDYIAANRLETNLLALYTMINKIIAEFEYCGAIICGQDFNLGGV